MCWMFLLLFCKLILVQCTSAKKKRTASIQFTIVFQKKLCHHSDCSCGLFVRFSSASELISFGELTSYSVAVFTFCKIVASEDQKYSTFD